MVPRLDHREEESLGDLKGENSKGESFHPRVVEAQFSRAQLPFKQVHVCSVKGQSCGF